MPAPISHPIRYSAPYAVVGSYLLSFALFVFMAYMVFTHQVDVPFWDQWEFIPTLDLFYKGKLSIEHLLSLHHEHRIFLPRIIMLGLAHISGWNTAYEVALNALLCLASFTVLVLLVRQSVGRQAFVIFPPMAVLVFSLCQVENLLWGWQISIFLNVFSSVLCIWALSQFADRVSGLLLGLVFALAATLSFANGLLTWPLGFAVVLFRWKQRKIALTVWAICATAVIFLYMKNFQRHPADPPIVDITAQLTDYIRYVLAYLGSPLVYRSLPQSIVAGALGLSTVFLCSIFLLRQQLRVHSLVPLLVLAGYAIISAAISGIGRLGMGVEQALSSRYTTVSLLLWVAVLALLIWCAATVSKPWVKMPMYTAIFVITVFSAMSSMQYMENFDRRYNSLSLGREALSASPMDDRNLQKICWKAKFVEEQSLTLKRYELSVFRP